MNVGEDTETLALWPAWPSKSNSPILLAAGMETLVAAPKLARPVYASCAGVNVVGGTNRSPVLTAIPAGVLREICPEPASEGTAMLRFVAVTDVGTTAGVTFSINSLFCAAESKFVPVSTVEPAAETI